MSDARVLIVVFDALRPEFVTDELMPNLSAFGDRGTRFSPRSTFPTETRVNQTTVLTGCYPRRHGVVANRFLAPDLDTTLLLDTGNAAALRRGASGGSVVCVPLLDERLAVAGKTYASLSAGTPGGGLLIGLTAGQTGALRYAMRGPADCQPAGLHEALTAAIGPPPEYTLPATGWIDWAVAAWLDHIDPVHRPDAMVLWLCEPDESFHYLGIGSPGARETIANADRAFGRIVAHHADALETGAMHIIAMSDHGQLTMNGEALDLPGRMAEAGIAASTNTLDGADCAVAIHSAGGIWTRDSDPELTRSITEWLQGHDWCGPLFTRAGLDGTLPVADALIDHARAPDIALALASTDAPNEFGLTGLSRHDAPYPGGGHGGLNAAETRNVLILGGSRVEAGNSEAAVGNIDIAPTVLDLLGLPPAPDMDGRTLLSAAAGQARTQTIRSAPANGFTTCLTFRTDGERRYLDRAWVER